MSDDRTADTGVQLMSWAGLYVVGLLIFALSVFLEIEIDFYHYSFFVYLAIGFFLNRRIGRKLAFHPMHNTLGEVSSSKLWSFLLWPLVYFGLLVRLAIDEVL